MIWIDRLALFSTIDFIGLFLLFTGWFTIGWITENPPKNKPSVSKLMVFYRQEWMRQFILRDPRIYDAQILSNLRQGTAFFASTSMIAIGGGLALIGNAERLTGVASDLTLTNVPTIVWEIKLIIMLFFIANAFLKFVWSHRLFGYAAVIMSAVPVDPNDPLCIPRAEKAAEINIAAARSYNRALRSVYFGLAATAWLGGGIALSLAAILTVFIVWRREFASISRAALLKSTL
ncbi:MAG: DUF599 domain-containing protein [Cognatishimia sp.]|uniref:DUF599 domain-containing protein n=1 Tax=Cognatishimia sp. 1_MG-2023 TaxID=3062642 RepID=UPI0026E287EB|nr:DUF599 domain-containing protein [Cognatishimia sp. 1_MG-2023]MDO6727866.1 DUF599 domain-containing protein [Cognatishimia sp. 1_MG-2023]